MNNNTEKKIILFSIFCTNESEAKENYIINYNRWRIKKSDMFWVDGVLYEKNKDPKETPLTDIDFKMNDIEPKYFGFKPEPKNTKISDTIIGYQLTESNFIQNEINNYSKFIDNPKSDLNDIALIKIDIYLKYLHQRKLELTQPQPATKDINEINTKKYGGLSFIALKHYYLHKGYPNSGYEITKENCNEIALNGGFTKKYSGKKLLDTYINYVKSETDRKNGSNMVQKLNELIIKLENYPESIYMINKELSNITNKIKKNKLVQ